MPGFENFSGQKPNNSEKKAWEAARDVLHGTRYDLDTPPQVDHVSNDIPDTQEVAGGSQETDFEVVPQSVEEYAQREFTELEAVSPHAEKTGLKRKLQRAFAVAAATLTLTASAPAFSEAASRNHPGRSAEAGVTLVVDNFFRGIGRRVEDMPREHQRWQQEAEKDARQRQKDYENELKRQQREYEKQQAEAEKQLQREANEFRKKLNDISNEYNRRIMEINRSYEAKKYGAIGSKEARAGREELIVQAREQYLQSNIDTKTIYGQPLNQEEQSYLDRQKPVQIDDSEKEPVQTDDEKLSPGKTKL